MEISKDELQDAVDVLSRPLTNLSLFYSYYSLVEVEDQYEYEFDLKQQTEKVKNAMYPYGVMAIIKELGHMDNQVKYTELANHIEEEYGTEINTYNELGVGLEEYYGNRYAAEIATFFLGGNQPYNLHEIYIGEFDFEPFIELDEELGLLTDVNRFLRASKLIFDNKYWNSEYGGEAWATVSRFMLNKDEVSDIIWVDTGFGIEHNTTTWLNKVGISGEEIDMLKDHGYTVPKKDRPITWVEYIREGIQPKLLDDKRHGDFSEIYKIASYTDNSIRRFTH